ncbi:E3 SUMO-protein ligase pli1, partial [Spiromyces aspiralis]
MMQASNCLESPEQLDVGKLRVVDLRHCLRYLAENLGVPVGQIRSNTLKSTLVQTLKQKLGEVYQSSNRATFEDTLAEINSLLAPRVSTFYAVTSYKWRDNVSYPMPVRPSPTIMSPSPGHTPTRRPVALSRSASGLRTGTESLGVSSARPDGEIGPPPGAYNKLLNQQWAASGTPGQQDYCYIAFKNLKFERSIYYDPITRVTPPRIGPDNRYGRSMVSLPFSLTSEQVEQLSKSKLAEASETKGIQKRLYLFMCSLDAANRSEVDPASWAKLEYPLGLDIRVNGQMLDVQKHLKRIPHTPIDITSLVSLNFNSYNNVIVTYQYNKRIMALVQMVNKYSHKSIAQKLLINRLVPEEVVREKFEKALEDDELVATGDVISLKCPLSQCRINVPVRPKQCTHTQCFDAESFLSMSEVTRELQCPVCYQKIQTWNDIV